MKRIAALTFALLLGTTAQAGDISISRAWIADAPPASMTRAAYLTLENASDAPVGIVSVTSDAFNMVHLHESKTQGDGVMSMNMVEQVEIAPGSTLEMVPGGLHIMLMHPKAEIAAGDSVPLMVTLSDGTVQKIDALVQAGPSES